jgi:nuclear transport factor 2 (NTF2) superfamily protein
MTDAERIAFLRDFADRWLAAWNSHDTEQVLALLDDDITWDDRTFWPEVIEGIDGVRRYTDRIWEVMPDVQFDEIGRFFDPDDTRGVVLFRQHGGPPAKVGGDARFDTHGCDIFLQFTEAGLLRRYLASYEITEMMRQLNLLPPRDGKVGGAYLRSLMGAAA